MKILKMLMNEIGEHVLHRFVAFVLKEGNYGKNEASEGSIVRLGRLYA